jgi:Ca2+-binding RTX toxin-like protein
MDRVVESDGGSTSSYGTIAIDAAAGETNTLSVDFGTAFDRPAVVVTDTTSPPTAQDRCQQLDANRVRCSSPDVESIASIVAELGDMDDSATSTNEQQLGYLAFVGGEGNDELIANWATLEGGPGDDRLIGQAGRDTLQGDAGNDLLDGHGEIDYLDGGPGDDVMQGGEGPDSLYAGGSINEPGPAGQDILDGGPGNDSLSDEDALDTTPEIGLDALIGGEGSDYVYSYIGRAEPVTVNLKRTPGQGQAGENDMFEGIENVIGGNGDDVLLGNAEPNYLDGEVGEDVILGGDGGDHILSVVSPNAPFENRLATAYGPDRISGDRGDDLIENLATMESEIACGGGDDHIALKGYARDPAQSSLGPLVSRTCERLSMDSETRPRVQVVMDPSPVRVRRKRLVFRFFKVRCCKHFMQVKRLTGEPQKQELARKRVRRKRISLDVGRRVIRNSRKEDVTLRGKVTKVAINRFVWRFQLGAGAF